KQAQGAHDHRMRRIVQATLAGASSAWLFVVDQHSEQRGQERQARLGFGAHWLALTAAVVEEHTQAATRRADRRAGDPARAHDARLARLLYDDGAVVDDGEVSATLLGALEGGAITRAELVHHVVLVDGAPLEIRAPSAQHQVSLLIEQEERDAAEANGFA